MIIGLDFDNCIISYDDVFASTAIEMNLIPNDGSIKKSKIDVRNYLRKKGKEDAWTELQGYVYGISIASAPAYPGAIKAICDFMKNGHDVHIISHKTRTPFLGPAYDLHGAAMNWIQSNIVEKNDPILELDKIHFNIQLIDKINCITTVGCHVFIDDLPEVLSHKGFPNDTKKFLFSPNTSHPNCFLDMIEVSSWCQFAAKISHA